MKGRRKEADEGKRKKMKEGRKEGRRRTERD